jgi:hypothetical protein
VDLRHSARVCGNLIPPPLNPLGSAPRNSFTQALVCFVFVILLPLSVLLLGHTDLSAHVSSPAARGACRRARGMEGRAAPQQGRYDSYVLCHSNGPIVESILSAFRGALINTSLLISYFQICVQLRQYVPCESTRSTPCSLIGLSAQCNTHDSNLYEHNWAMRWKHITRCTNALFRWTLN